MTRHDDRVGRIGRPDGTEDEVFDLWINRVKVKTSPNGTALVEEAKRRYATEAGVFHAAVYTADGDLVIELDP
jgi:hypothetical protein